MKFFWCISIHTAVERHREHSATPPGAHATGTDTRDIFSDGHCTMFINVGWLTAYISEWNNELKIYAKFNSRMFLLILKVILYVQFKENGSVMRFFDIFFLHESNQPRSVINRLKWFCWKIRFCRDIQMLSLKNLTSAVLVCVFVNISVKKNLSANYFSIFFIRGPGGLDS